MSLAQHKQFDLRRSAESTGGKQKSAFLLVRAGEDSTELLASLYLAAEMDIKPVDRAHWPGKSREYDATNLGFLIVEAPAGSPEDIDYIRQIKADTFAPRLPVIALVERNNEYASLQAIKAGADAVISKPLAASEMSDVFSRLETESQAPVDWSEADTKVVVFMHLTGGAGATTLAVNVSCALSQTHPHRETCLLDLDLQFGTTSNFLDLTFVSPILDFIQDPSRLDKTMLESMMAQHPSGLHVLTPPRSPVPLDALNPANVGDLLRVAKSRYRNIVIDLPVALAPWSDTVLRAANVVYLVTPMTVPAAHRITKFMNLLRSENLAHLPVKIVVNRYNATSKSGVDLSQTQFAKAIGQQIDHLIPNEYSLVAQSQNQGTPAIRVKPKSRFALAIQRMVDTDIKNVEVSQEKKIGLFRF